MTDSTYYLMESVLLPRGWASDMIVEVGPDGIIRSVDKHQQTSGDHQTLSGAVIPGVPNCHSHAHQRAMSGLGERASIDAESGKKATDSFWTWRVAMYHFLERMQPHHLYAISRQLYLEMLKSGYTNIAEFQYLHHDPLGNRYDNPAEMTLQCMQSAMDVGIGFTALPVLYRYGGFGGQDPIDWQRRFLNDADSFCELVSRLFDASAENASGMSSVGIAPHSLRAVTDTLLNEVIGELGIDNLAAVHVHVAEQTKEVDDCMAWSGERPVEWMLSHFEVNEKWCAIHATHMTSDETVGLAKSGAIAGLCPTTEGNLGDGFFNLNEYIANNGRWAIGSDSHISISPVEELRWLEYGRRLVDRQRNIMASSFSPSTGTALLEQSLHGGRISSGLDIGKIEPGYRADFVVLDSDHPRLYGRKEEQLIDSWIFSGNENAVQDVYVGGVRVIQDGHHPDEEDIQASYRKTLDELNA